MASEEKSLCSLNLKISRFRVSSVMNKDVKQFGKQNLFDDEETCWNSDQGSPQWVLMEFQEEVSVSSVHIQFQGGFTGKDCALEASGVGQDRIFTHFHSFFPQDTNSLQVFDVPQSQPLKCLKIIFNDSTDFFGRVTIYKLDILGT